jgi:hypothetical protein
MCVKPTSCILAIPLALRSRRYAVEVVAGVVGAAVIALPFAIVTGIPTFIYSVLGVELKYSLRPLPLAVSDPLYVVGVHRFLFAITGVALLIAVVHVVVHRPRSLCAALTGAAFVGIVSNVFNAFAYFNYYTLIAVLIVLALVAPRRGEATEQAPAAVPSSRLVECVSAGSTPFR